MEGDCWPEILRRLNLHRDEVRSGDIE